MADLTLELLGGFAGNFSDGRRLVLPTRKAQALVAYLAMPTGRFHAREKLTALLWGETAESLARQSFRQALAGVRRAFGASRRDFLHTQGDTVAIDPACVSVDAQLLQKAVAEATRPSLERIASLYRGDFLEALQVDEAGFTEWRSIERERLHALALDGLSELLSLDLAADRREAAIRTAQRMLALDPSQEPVHRTLIRLYLAGGRRAAALRQYQACADWLRGELETEPESETQALYRDIVRSPESAQAVPARKPVGNQPPLIGRAPELATLHGVLTRALDAGGRVALVHGEAGVGKTRLIREFLAEAATAGMHPTVGQCHETEQILPLRVWSDALRIHDGTLDPELAARLDPEAAARLAWLFPELGQNRPRAELPSEQYSILFDALVQLVHELALGQPLLIVLEDLHWADAHSVRFLPFLARRLRGLPVLIVASLRSDELAGDSLLSHVVGELGDAGLLSDIALQPLSQVDTTNLVASLLPSAQPKATIATMAARAWQLSEGNPFVIVEQIAALKDVPREHWLSGEWIAPGVSDFVSRRLERIAPDAQQLIAAAAVAGRGCSLPLLAAAVDLDELNAARHADELVRRRLLVSDGSSLDFSHDRVRAVAYRRLLPQHRRVLHARMGAALESAHADDTDRIADQLGHHYARAGDAQRAVTWLTRFATLAVQAYSLDAAYRALEQARALVDELPAGERARWVLDLVLRQAFVVSSQGRPQDVRDMLATHAALAGEVSDARLVSEYHFRVALTAIYLNDRTAGRAAAMAAYRAAERAALREPMGKALYVLSLNDYESGRPSDGIAHAEQAAAMLRDIPGAIVWFGLTHYVLALNQVIRGELDAAVDAAAQADRIGELAAWPRVRALAGYVHAWALALKGDCDLAIAVAQQALAHAKDPMSRSLVSGAMALAHLERGDGVAAVPVLDQVVAQLRRNPVRSGETRHMALLAEAQWLAGDPEQARRTALDALAGAEADAMAFNTGLAERVLGRIALTLADADEARRYFAAALAAFDACEAGFEAARTGAELAAIGE